MYDTVCLVESQVDWLTASAEKGAKADALRDASEALCAQAVADGERTRPFAFYGYQGLKAGRVRFGVSDRGALLQLSGDLADKHLASVLPLCDRVTRLDLAVTFQFPEDRPDVATVAAVDYHQWWRAHGELPDYRLIVSGKGGETLYVGDRTSDYFLRIYDKARESKDPRYVRCWRCELECKGSAAASAAPALADSASRAADVRSKLHDYLTRHGIRPCFDRDSSDVLWTGFRRRSDTDSNLLWLSSRVSPTVARLLNLGYGDELRSALGLDEEPPTPRPTLRSTLHAVRVQGALAATDLTTVPLAPIIPVEPKAPGERRAREGTP